MLMAENETWNKPLAEGVNIMKAQVIWAVRHEMARTVEDVLARRTRLLFIDAKAAWDLAPVVAEIMKEELKETEQWKEKQIASFVELAKGYLIDPGKTKPMNGKTYHNN
jgi:glycerol-3-phosphate dehydrogenase